MNGGLCRTIWPSLSLAALSLAYFVCWLLPIVPVQAAVISEQFVVNPLASQWRVFGDSNLFVFNQAAQKLSVTWDSSRSNSYYYLPLPYMLNRDEDFSMALDLELSDFQGGVNTNKSSTFQLAFGFMNMLDAFKPTFFRGNSSLTPNLVEFDFFPDTGFGPTVWPSIWSTNSSLNYNGSSDYTILELPIGVVMRVTMSYTASNQTLHTSIRTNGIAVGSIASISLSASFTDFRLNAFALESYSDAGQDPQFGGSLLAHGSVDNIVLTLPPSPIQDFVLIRTNQQWHVAFQSRSNWVYAVERATNLETWVTTSASLPGTGGKLFWQDTNAASIKAFYRVRAERE
jgi:hypothetical protein